MLPPCALWSNRQLRMPIAARLGRAARGRRPSTTPTGPSPRAATAEQQIAFAWEWESPSQARQIESRRPGIGKQRLRIREPGRAADENHLPTVSLLQGRESPLGGVLHHVDRHHHATIFGWSSRGTCEIEVGRLTLVAQL